MVEFQISLRTKEFEMGGSPSGQCTPDGSLEAPGTFKSYSVRSKSKRISLGSATQNFRVNETDRHVAAYASICAHVISGRLFPSPLDRSPSNLGALKANDVYTTLKLEG